uniref:Tektin n=1 Tax=Timema monikensis TaxID=170555 RepID=A0A7R9EBN1_9NEOP|nr:unnamed protein product [Timema monikensis]
MPEGPDNQCPCPPENHKNGQTLSEYVQEHQDTTGQILPHKSSCPHESSCPPESPCPPEHQNVYGGYIKAPGPLEPIAEYPPSTYPKGHPCYISGLKDCAPPPASGTEEGQDTVERMGPIGPWATGRVDWGPLSGLTGTRPVVDRYSITRFSDGEWRKMNAELVSGAGQEQHRANLLDFNSRRCAEQIAAHTDKDQLSNTRRLEQRAHDVHRWKCELERAVNLMGEELNLLEHQRQRLKTAMGVLRMPESIAGECLERRTARLEPDLVRDQVEEELIKEIALINEVRDLMSRMLTQMEEQQKINKAVKQRLEMDWSDKKEAYEIETANIGLKNTSPTILFHPGATRFADGQSTPETWEFLTRENLDLLETERNKSKDLRHILEVMLTDISRDLRVQSDRVETSLACRIVETDEARRRFENDLLQTLRRIADTEKLILDLKSAIRAQDFPMKVAQTRLNNRMGRPRAENCRDVPQFGLVDEVKSLSESVSALLGQLKQAEKTLAALLKIRSDLEKGIMVKRKTLSIDKDRCQEIRSHYPSSVALTGY